ncbi:NUDIX domain-containing protein [Jannaschia sp. S6380]|uniref:NUDIX domain-containing protein n=1 Tax=Jannaschia sp. S6380 TaxID=2926408 RepID=UPI001FF21EFE|nr:NUDIX domain-containing protein [Jannaschia sp. S6380]MCK0166311.1 NUDIX domain-containing protein [Jannaschia sp. S6380]
MPGPGATHDWTLRAGLTARPGAVTKVCPVVLRGNAILAFCHPRAGCQLVKGTPEPGEIPPETALRELREESGIATGARGTLPPASIGTPAVVWHFVLVRTPPLPPQWSHWCEDDGGHLFRFFWHPLTRQPGPAWHPVHRQALTRIRRSLRRSLPCRGPRP